MIDDDLTTKPTKTFHEEHTTAMKHLHTEGEDTIDGRTDGQDGRMDDTSQDTWLLNSFSPDTNFLITFLLLVSFYIAEIAYIA